MEDADSKPLDLMDAAIGLVAVAAGTAGVAVSVTRRIARAAAPVGSTLLHPPVLTKRLHPARAVDALADRGREAMTSTRGDFERMIAILVPAVVNEVLDRLDLNGIIPERVDLDGLIATVDIADVVDRVGIDVVVQQVNIGAIVDRLDLNSILQRVDLDALVQRVDLDAIAQRVDLDAIVQRVDLNAIAERLDLDAVVDRIDLDRVVARIDVDAIVAGMDLNAIVDRLNVVGLAEEVINEIDLPEIIRDSTGSMASQVVRDARMQSIDADEAVSRVVDRLLRRRQKRSTDAPIRPRPEGDSISVGEPKP
jgi:hypothetical protein